HEQGDRDRDDLAANWLSLEDLQGVRAILAQEQGVGDARFTETPGAKDTTVARAARSSILQRSVAAVREPVVEAELGSAADDVGLAERDQGRVHAEPRAFDAGAGAEVRKPLESGDEFRPAIGIT